MNAITVLENDHRRVERLFQRFERTNNPEQQRRIADELVRELSVHAVIEEQLVYPRLKQALSNGGAGPARSTHGAGHRHEGRARGRDHAPTGERRIYLSLEEHHLAKVALAEIEKLPATDDRLDGKVRVLAENVRHHVEEEERELLPTLERALKPQELEQLGDVLQRARKLAPTRPHPFAPDEPPGNLVVGAAASAYDRARLALDRAMAAGLGSMRRALRLGTELAARARTSVGETARDAKDVARSARDGARSAREEARSMAHDAVNVARKSAAST